MIHGRQAAWLLLGAALVASDQASAARVSGQVTTPDGRPLVSAAVTMAPQDEGAGVPPASATIAPDGRFSFVNVRSGRYEVRARGQTQNDDPTLFGTFALTVGARDVENVEVALREGATLEGSLSLDRARGARPPPLVSLIVRAPLADGTGFGDALTGRVKNDGSFVIRGLMPGPHYVFVEGLPDVWMLASVHVRGREVTDAPFDADERQRFDDVRVAITDAVTRVDVDVSAGKGLAADIPVAVFPSSPEFWIRGSRRVRFARTDAAGRATITGLPPGAYLATARRSLDVTPTSDVRALDRLRVGATAFTVAAGAAETRVMLHIDEGTAARR